MPQPPSTLAILGSWRIYFRYCRYCHAVVFGASQWWSHQRHDWSESNSSLLGNSAWFVGIFRYAWTFTIYGRGESRGKVFVVVKKYFFDLDDYWCNYGFADHNSRLCHGEVTFPRAFSGAIVLYFCTNVPRVLGSRGDL